MLSGVSILLAAATAFLHSSRYAPPAVPLSAEAPPGIRGYCVAANASQRVPKHTPSHLGAIVAEL
jgi:hypothetical protein